MATPKPSLKTLVTSHLHLVVAAALECYALLRNAPLPFALALVVKACWLWEFHLRAQEATFGARIFIQWCYRLAVAFALLPATGAFIRECGGFVTTTPVADAIAKVAALDGWVAVSSAVRGGDWAFRALRSSSMLDMRWGVFLAMAAGIEVSALRKCRERTLDVKCAVPPLSGGSFKRLRRLRRHLRSEAVTAPASCDARADLATLAGIAGAISLVDALTRFVRSGRGAPRRATHFAVRVATNPLLPFLGVAARWLDADVRRPFALLRVVVGLDALRSAVLAAAEADAAPPPPPPPPAHSSPRRRSSAGGIYGDVGRSPPRSPRRQLVL